MVFRSLSTQDYPVACGGELYLLVPLTLLPWWLYEFCNVKMYFLLYFNYVFVILPSGVGVVLIALFNHSYR